MKNKHSTIKLTETETYIHFPEKQTVFSQSPDLLRYDDFYTHSGKKFKTHFTRMDFRAEEKSLTILIS